MSLPSAAARLILTSTQTAAFRNLVAQSKAKQVLREVRELIDNYPAFAEDLDERVTFGAYAILAAACSLVENGETREGREELHSAADILEATHRTEAVRSAASALHCLIGGMAFYACGQYSRAFVLLKDFEGITPAAGIIASYLRKDRPALIGRLNGTLLAQPREFEDSPEFDEWAVEMCIARAVALATEYSLSGDPRLLEAADQTLVDSMAICEAGRNQGSWWLARLLRLMLRDHGTAALWTVLPPFFDPETRQTLSRYIGLLSFLQPPVVELWQSQVAALALALDRTNLGGVVNLRTSAGKTRVAEIAILQTLATDPNAKVLFLAPFRSLAFELERTFVRTLGPLGYSVSHLYGGSRFSSVDRELVNDGNVTIATPEKAKAMLRAAPEVFEALKLVVIDEGHLLGGTQRNVRNELFLEHIRLLCRHRNARLLLLSAVLPNAEDLATWIGGNPTALARSEWKPAGERFGTLKWTGKGVRIDWRGAEPCFNPHFVDLIPRPGPRTRTLFPNTKSEAVAATAVRLAELGPVLIFAGQARWVASMVRAVLFALGPNAPPHPWPALEWALFDAVCKEELGDTSPVLAAARVGVIGHNTDLPPQVRISLEKLMARHPPRIIVATTTLGQGVNLGISSVIVATPSIGQSDIRKRDFWNICGRAGRAFVDSEGKMLYAIDATKPSWSVRRDEATATAYFDRQHLDRVSSGLRQVISKLLEVAGRAAVSFEVLLELAANDTFDRLGPQKHVAMALVDWIDDHLLALHVAFRGDDPDLNVDWVDAAFRDSLAVIQERAGAPAATANIVPFLRARTTGILRKVTSAPARRAIVASGLPLSVSLAALQHLDVFRAAADLYATAPSREVALVAFVQTFETWARQHARTIVGKMPDATVLDRVRPLWLAGEPLARITDEGGDEALKACTDLFGYQLPWLFHAVAQKLDKATEEARISSLAEAGLLAELGLPNIAAGKVFLAGVRSRSASTELSRFVTDGTHSVSRIRKALLDPDTREALSARVSISTLQWLQLLSPQPEDHEAALRNGTTFQIDLDIPDAIDLLHVRRLGTGGGLWLCSTDGRFKRQVGTTGVLDNIANDPCFVLSRTHNGWEQICRDPRRQPLADEAFGTDDFFF